MTIGEKLKQARLEAGLSQRQVCGDAITRNMLSLIENGAARPSMDTLKYLAARLGKSVSFFLEETSVETPNPQVMADARQAYVQHKFAALLDILATYQGPDPLFDEEMWYLSALAALGRGEELLKMGDAKAAAPLLEQVHRGSIYYRPDLEQRRRLLLEMTYQQLEEYYRLQGDFQQAYLYACKLRNFS